MEKFRIDRFDGGLDERLTLKAGANTTPDCRNLIARPGALLQKRGGQLRVHAAPLAGPVTGLHAYYQPSARHLIVAAGGKAYRRDPVTLEFLEIASGLSPTALTQFATCVNYMVVFDGVNPPWKWDGTTVTPLANAPADGWLVCYHKEKVFTVSKAEPSTLLWPTSFMPEVWPAVNYWKVADGDGDELKAILAYQGTLVALKSRSVHVLRGTDLEDFVLDDPSQGHGAVGPNAAVVSGNYLWFIDQAGIFRFNGYSAVNVSEAKLVKLWPRVNRSALHLAAAGVHGELLWFAVPIDGSPANNLVLVYDPKGDAWWPMSGIEASVFLDFDDGTGNRFLSGGSLAPYVSEQDIGTSDDGAGVVAYWFSPPQGADAPEAMKKMFRLYTNHLAGADADGVSVARVGPTTSGYFDSLSTIDLVRVPSEDSLCQGYDFPDGSYCRYFQIRLQHQTTAALMAIQSIVGDLKVQAGR